MTQATRGSCNFPLSRDFGLIELECLTEPRRMGRDMRVGVISLHRCRVFGKSRPEQSSSFSDKDAMPSTASDLPSDSSPSWVEDNSQPSDPASIGNSTIPSTSPCVRLRKTSNQKNSRAKKNGRNGHLKKTHSDESKGLEDTLASPSEVHAGVGDKIGSMSTKKDTFEPEDDVETFVFRPAPKAFGIALSSFDGKLACE
nr:unnamed protein product [Spirometra erinaceieuropaei]